MIFNTNISVPSHVIKRICEDVRNLLLSELIADEELSDRSTYKINKLMDKVISHYVNTHESSYEGITLDRGTITEIANSLARGNRVSGIKELRRVTGMHLHSAAEIMKRFDTTEDGAKEFVCAFS